MCAKPKTMMIDGMPVLIENEKNILFDFKHMYDFYNASVNCFSRITG